ncbi:anti-sigma factor [Neobacillus sp. DY30]|uniref:anti-sigma factor n=1 Tax=Neobacillus sp. DY30 TaxID=3047871 RepID=UPI0024BF53F3|nr:anti-sigma factor [Neobacillus sp. DY30]WHY00677.1 anti-sigma factor [Neobacillus sp. DY30]
MSTLNSCSFSNELVSFLIGEESKDERNTLKDHLINCSSCRIELEELQEAWNLIPYKLDDVEVPSELKVEVMNHIFSEEKNPSPITNSKQSKKSIYQYNLYKWAAAVFFLAFAGVLWSHIYHSNQFQEETKQTQAPTKVLQVFALKSNTPSDTIKQGKAWLYQQGDKKQLVFQLEGLTETKGTEAYQVWLIREGKRRSAGVFHVDSQGNGVLTYELKENEEVFEAIGVSLEPDANGTQPRGQKVLGT